MTGKNVTQSSDLTQTIFAALCVIVALLVGCWFMAYHAYVMAPTTEAITVTLPPGVTASKAGSAELLQTVEIEQERPGREYLAALLHPFGFMALLLAIIGAGGGLILLIVWLDRGVRYGRQ